MKINSNASLKPDDDWMKAYMDYLAALSEQGPTFSLGSDAHNYDGLAGVPRAWKAADQLGLDESRIFRPGGTPLNR